MRHRFSGALFRGLGIVLVLGSTASPAEDEIHECRDADGNVIYQHDPCSRKAARRSTVRNADLARLPTEAPLLEAPGIQPWLDPDPVGSPEEPSRPADSRLVSPERTWRTFLAALRDGDRELAATCLAESALSEFGARIQTASPESLREAASAYTGIVFRGDAGPFRAASLSRADGGTKWIFFEKTANGEWKIAAF